MKILLTGATGFVGSHVAQRLVAAGHAVRLLSRTNSPRAALGDAATKVEWVVGDIVDAPSVRPAVEGCEAVIHAAARVTFNPKAAALQRAVTVDGHREVIAPARDARVRRRVYTSLVV